MASVAHPMKKSLTYLAFVLGVMAGTGFGCWIEHTTLRLTTSHGFVVVDGELYGVVPIGMPRPQE